MDLQTMLVCGVVVILSGAVLFVISIFGIKEKTYEEAIAEQRKMPEDALLLRPNKDKNKDKKQKRQGKKVKEKPAKNANNAKEAAKNLPVTETDSESMLKETEHYTHVNFVSPESELVQDTAVQAHDDKKKKKKDKVKPILLNKEEPVAIRDKVDSSTSISVNHFESTIPKDDLELKLAATKNDVNNPNASANLNSKDKPNSKLNKETNKTENLKNPKNELKVLNNNTTKSNKNEKIKNDNAVKAEAVEIISAVNQEQLSVQQLKVNNQQQSGKDAKNKKNKRNELSTLQQISDHEVSIQLLIPLIRKAELSRTEVQTLTDLLLNKHTENDSEWIEGRQDPVVKLKKQLAEKEKALTEEQEASQACQNKLKELRLEYNAERAKLTQMCRQYEETMLAKQSELQNLHSRLQHLHDSHVNEKQVLSTKIQQLQAQINDENLMIRKLQEDNNQTHNALQQELVNQRQQLEIHMARLNEQHQEAENTLKGQIHAQIQEMESLTSSLNGEAQARRRCEEELRELREQNVQSQNKIKTLESRASHLKESSSHSQELARQIEELQRTNKDLEKRYGSVLQAEEELKYDKKVLQSDLHSFTNKMSELQSKCDKLAAERDELLAQIAAKSDLDRDIQRLKEENQCLNSQVSSLAKLEKEVKQLREENENMAAQYSSSIGRENGDSSYNEDKKSSINVDFINHENEIKKKDIVVDKLNEELKQKDSTLEKLTSELNASKSEVAKLHSEITNYKTELPRLRDELEAQRNKNNDLRQKNWKAMEALTTTEKALDSKIKETEKLSNERVQKIRSDEQSVSKGVLERLFPDVKVNEKVYENWIAKFEVSAKTYMNDIKTEVQQPSPSPAANESIVDLENKNSQLQVLVTHYKTIIEDTEGMLNKLQNHIEQEEIRWNQQMETKQQEIDSLKKEQETLVDSLNSQADGFDFAFNCIEKTLPAIGYQLQSKIKELETAVANEKQSREKMAAELDSVRTQLSDLKERAEKEADRCKALSSEKESLTEKLSTEQERFKDLNKEVVKLRSTVKIGQDAFTAEHQLRLSLENQLDQIAGKSNHRDLPVSSTPDVTAQESRSSTESPQSVSEALKKLKSKIRKDGSEK